MLTVIPKTGQRLKKKKNPAKHKNSKFVTLNGADLQKAGDISGIPVS